MDEVPLIGSGTYSEESYGAATQIGGKTPKKAPEIHIDLLWDNSDKKAAAPPVQAPQKQIVPSNNDNLIDLDFSSTPSNNQTPSSSQNKNGGSGPQAAPSGNNLFDLDLLNAGSSQGTFPAQEPAPISRGALVYSDSFLSIEMKTNVVINHFRDSLLI